VALAYRIKARAKREIEKTAEWWAENRPAAPGAVRKDVEDALKILVEQSDLGTKVETGRSPQVRRFLLDRTSHFLYYRVRRSALEVLSVWHTNREHGPKV